MTDDSRRGNRPGRVSSRSGARLEQSGEPSCDYSPTTAQGASRRLFVDRMPLLDSLTGWITGWPITTMLMRFVPR